MEEYVKNQHKDDCEIERSAEKLLQLLIQPHLFRELSNVVNQDKEFYHGTTIEIQDSTLLNDHDDDDEKDKTQEKKSSKEDKKETES